ncbi:MAG: hypothetical protein WC779_08430 [Candidatus Omnitrophota bacterium]|jgi:hypothetical protein
MSLDQKDLELIERVVYKNSDDIAVSIARSFERLEERVDASESRLYSRLGDIDDKIPERRNAFQGLALESLEEGNREVTPVQRS